MHKLYIEKCSIDNVEDIYRVKECTYRNIFVNEFNFSFGQPRSDTCSTCDAGLSNDEHVENYHAAFNLLKSDRENAKISENTVYITIDLQQTMPLPRLSTSKAFNLRQMWMYNLGIHIFAKNVDKAIFCTWTEDKASRGSSEVVSSLLTVIETDESLKNKDHLIIWSDSCAGQNKNFLMICLYQYLISKEKFKSIEHKFPEVGHTYLDSDRDFGRIEKNLRKYQNLYTPQEYRQIIASSCRNSVVLDMTPHFRNTTDLDKKMRLYNRKADVLRSKVQFRDGVKWIRVEEYGSYLFKACYDENTPFRKVNIRQGNLLQDATIPVISIPRLSYATNALKQPKVENLRDQLVFIPEEHRWWYLDVLNSYL